MRIHLSITPASPVDAMSIVNFIGFSLVFHWFFIGFSCAMSINVNQCRSMPIPMMGEAGGNAGSVFANLSSARRRPYRTLFLCLARR